MSETQTAPLTLNIQYTKDLSFEVPNAPAIYTILRQPPAVNINLDVQVRRLQEDQNVYEVTLATRAEATIPTPPEAGNGSEPGKEMTVFIADLSYSGIFTLTGIPENQVEPVLLVECPRLLFPFARNILADVTRDGGFPPVMLGPVDFVGLWQSRREQMDATPVANA
ncbi:MAG: protein-export chaperone SecB [Acidiphilium sp.]|nr:protein-export chaperone SecB [Acidiphilium sp.]MDD4934698.1 protein-export chaperone SecB [Acidiphilium sp.]